MIGAECMMADEAAERLGMTWKQLLAYRWPYGATAGVPRRLDQRAALEAEREAVMKAAVRRTSRAERRELGSADKLVASEEAGAAGRADVERRAFRRG